MSRVITFSRYFPRHHPKEGRPTFFVEQILNSLEISYRGNDVPLICANSMQLENNKFSTELIASFRASLDPKCTDEKKHTIRRGNRWKAGDMFSPRVWSGKPYQSKQIAIAPDTEIKRVAKIVILENGFVYLNDTLFAHLAGCDILANNDGLDNLDFTLWIGKPFSGQILIWNDTDLPY